MVCAGSETAIALCRREFEELIICQLEAYTEKPADMQDLRNACRQALPCSCHMSRQSYCTVWLSCAPPSSGICDSVQESSTPIAV